MIRLADPGGGGVLSLFLESNSLEENDQMSSRV